MMRQKNNIQYVPPEVKSLNDIKRLVAELDPSKSKILDEVNVNTTMVAESESGKKQEVQLSTSTKSKSKRDMLIEGLDVIKNWMLHCNDIQTGVSTEINGVVMKPARIGDVSRGKTRVDGLISQWLGGYRDGTYICWDLSDGFTYRYDIYEHKLTRTQRESDSLSTI